MIKTPLSTVIGGAFWTPGAVQIGSSSKNLTQLIKSLFSDGEQGFAYDPNDLTTLYQDAAGTIPVTAAGQPVGLMKDKSGRNNHASQTVSASRPILQRNATTGAYYLAFDGADDFLQTNSIDFTATDKVSLFAGVRKLSDATAGCLFEISANSATVVGTFGVLAPLSSGDLNFRSGGSLPAAGTTTTPQLQNIDFVITANADIGSRTATLKVDGKVRANSTTNQGTGNYGNYPLYIGRRGGTSLPFGGHLYSLIAIARLTTGSETISLEKAIAKNTGVILNV